MMKKTDKNDLTKKIVFAFLMGAITTGLISFALITINIGFTSSFFKIWIKSWILAYIFVIPAILFIAPKVEQFAHAMVDNYTKNRNRNT